MSDFCGGLVVASAPLNALLFLVRERIGPGEAKSAFPIEMIGSLLRAVFVEQLSRMRSAPGGAENY
jgi:hypothetical protein